MLDREGGGSLHNSLLLYKVNSKENHSSFEKIYVKCYHCFVT